jgi:kynurenine formamidase
MAFAHPNSVQMGCCNARQASKRYGAVEPDIDTAAAEYPASLNVVAAGADTGGIEAVPFRTRRVWEGHQVLLGAARPSTDSTAKDAAVLRQGCAQANLPAP